MPKGRLVAAAAAAAALLAYALFSFALMAHAPHHPWAAAALFGPLVLVVAASGWQRRHLPTLLGCAAAVAVLAWVVARGGVADINRLYVLQHAGIHLALAWGFGVTLRPGATALITMLAERVHQHFTQPMRDYTRRLTAVWVGYFVGMVVLSLAVYGLAPWSWWSFFCTLVTPATAVALFVGEHLWRYRRHPEFERASLSQAWQAYQQHERQQDRRRADAEAAP